MSDRYSDGRVKRPVKLDAYMWSLETQGDVVHLCAHPLDYESRGSTKGRRVMGFSDESRRRLLRLISRINWTSYTCGLFLTVTCPDESWVMTLRERTMNRHRLFRDIENHLGEQFTCIWRIEWKPRLSGWWENHMLPHWHFIVPGVPYLHMDVLNELWRRILGRSIDEPLATRVDSLTDEHHQQVYIAKYAAKATNINGLDSVVHLNTGGRHWGIHRRNLLAVHPIKTYHDLTPGIVARLRRVASETLENYDPRYDAGFTLHGEAAKRNLDAVREIILDSGKPAE